MEKGGRFWELATAKLHGEISDREAVELDELLGDVENKKAYLKISKLKEDVGELDGLSEFSKQNSWSRVTNHLRSKKTNLILNFSKYAAIIVVAFLLGNWVNNHFLNTGKGDYLAEVRVPLGQMSEITLYDGTHVWLNSGTTLSYGHNFGKKERSVNLDGEAFFKVKKDNIPFKVKLNNSEIEVKGTCFNVVSYRNENFSEVTLVEGKVEMSYNNGASITELKPSQQFCLNDSGIATVKTVDTRFYSSWTHGKIVFEDESLSNIIPKLERWYNIDIKIKDKAIGDLKFSGTILKHKPFNQILTTFELLLPIDIKYTSNPGRKDLVIITEK